MKKNILTAILALFSAAVAFAASPVTEATPARAPQPVTAVMGAASSTYTVVGLSISSAPATSVVIDTLQMYRQVCVQNLDTSSALYCSENVNVSTNSASALIGVVISAASAVTTPNGPTCFSIVGGMNFYCKNGGAGSTRAVIVRAR